MEDNLPGRNEPKPSPLAKRLLIAVVGGVVLLVGIVAIPYPGPGWLIVFAGLAILATEFAWAERYLQYGRRQYDKWNLWIKKQNLFIQSLTLITTTIIVVLTLWIINAYGILNNILNLNLDWLRSPLLKN